MKSWLNPAVRRDGAYRGTLPADTYARVDAFFHSAEPTPLVAFPSLAATLGIRDLTVKDESSRFGVSAFKALGARYAMASLQRSALAAGVVCATAGNHGRAVALVARDLGVACTVFLPECPPDAPAEERAVRQARADAMRADGAEVVEVAGSYEAALERAAEHAFNRGSTIVSDTGRPGDEEVPRQIASGYTRLFSEAAVQWHARPDVLIVQAGVGGLASAAADWSAFHYGASRPYLIVCEPDAAACLQESSRNGAPVRLPDPLPSNRTFMAGLRCAEPSITAWPSIRGGVDAFVSIPDEYAADAMRRLEPQIHAGPSGACGVGALLALVSEAALRDVREAAGIGPSTRVLAIVTEGK